MPSLYQLNAYTSPQTRFFPDAAFICLVACSSSRLSALIPRCSLHFSTAAPFKNTYQTPKAERPPKNNQYDTQAPSPSSLLASMHAEDLGTFFPGVIHVSACAAALPLPVATVSSSGQWQQWPRWARGADGNNPHPCPTGWFLEGCRRCGIREGLSREHPATNCCDAIFSSLGQSRP